MKRKLLLIGLLVVAVAGIFLVMKKQPQPSSATQKKKLPPPWVSTELPKKSPASVPQPAEKAPVAVVGKKPPVAVLKVVFDAPNPPRLNEPVAVTLVIEKNPNNWPADVGSNPTLNILLRLPPGVKLSGEGWTPTPLPPEEKKDQTGPWSLYAREETLTLVSDSSSLVLVRIPASFTLVEEGVNWIITARARLSQGKQVWQSFGVIFATLSQGEAAFHSIPKANDAKTN